ncbi:hypothetical protein BCV72DRAFT_306089 [Rhizopus microsporus var. microsporus]|uniref:Uncharacterized protein n=2 Tax=Rhizopus microsporus TaxID=58291 RepID=A0A2G4T988_RHIZD|nr:uncharacterized protein RHIMIDRAFT_233003 [Rhizopus microsporus ATCC 52813]ORE05806.1 hypothetical protein BCV72DRAFT_306089 [Rhizopus microsporus var. microsporus]PHZ17574.1 hypothetical protein RHIMIDRAFT_233003 [Rhizopus microsporus ATCC 52813]
MQSAGSVSTFDTIDELYEATVNTGAIQGAHSYVHQPGERLQERSDKEKDKIICVLDHLHAFCNYISNYYKEKQGTDETPPQSTMAREYLLPFAGIASG